MPRGKRQLSFNIYKEPEIPFLSFVIKVTRRLKWPEDIERHPSAKLLKANILYEIAGAVFSEFRIQLYLYRRLVLGGSDNIDLTKMPPAPIRFRLKQEDAIADGVKGGDIDSGNHPSPAEFLQLMKTDATIGSASSFKQLIQINKFWATIVPKVRSGSIDTAKLLSRIDFLRLLRANAIIENSESFKLLVQIDKMWAGKFATSLEKSFKNKKVPRFSPEAYIFRCYAKNVLDAEQNGNSPNYASGFKFWCDKQGYKFGLFSITVDEKNKSEKSFDYDTLLSRCRTEDLDVDKEFESLGFHS